MEILWNIVQWWLFFLCAYIDVEFSEGVLPALNIYISVSLVSRSSSVSAEARSSGSFRNLSLTQILLSGSVRALWTGWGVYLPALRVPLILHSKTRAHKQTNKLTRGLMDNNNTLRSCWDLCFIAGNDSFSYPECTNTPANLRSLFLTNYVSVLSLMSTGAERNLLTCHTAHISTFLSHTHTFSTHWYMCAGFVIFHWTHVRLADAKTLRFLLYGWFLLPMAHLSFRADMKN